MRGTPDAQGTDLVSAGKLVMENAATAAMKSIQLAQARMRKENVGRS